MLTSDFDYNLPPELIAQFPISPRDHSRLFVVDRESGKLEHQHFFNIVDYLQPGDLLVWNNSKVFKARLFGKLEAVDKDVNKDGVPDKPLLRQQEVEIFLVREMENKGVWKVLAKPGRRVREGMRIIFDWQAAKNYSKAGISRSSNFYCDAMVKEKDGTILVQFPDDADVVRAKANRYGQVPTPPYIKKQDTRNKTQTPTDNERLTGDEEQLSERYQTVYAKSEGSVAAPTAGFHFTPELIEQIKNKGVEFAEVTLHVGLGTFLPVKSEKVEEHRMHAEWVELSKVDAEKINRAKAEGRRVVAVGTTTVRTLEGIAQQMQISDCRMQNNVNEDRKIKRLEDHVVRAYKGDINIFITPGFEFKVVDAMITNFHLPKSTLLMLVSAFIGDREKALQIYQEAVKEQYRFYSFGDAMFIS
jgi:S-adenosylmethionine:tRNA ribosyltransferase-isomerase